ncbi:MAG: fibronectin type III domain-containing protein [Thermoplasmata archaeon]|nr:MAG: fibronectin type III domain-containing protein [Thermoplasmata archaeon]
MLSALAPVMMVSAATDMFPDTVYRGSLDSLGPRDDFNFTARANEWTVLASNNYQGNGAYRHGLRSDITSKNPILFAEVGSIANTRSAGVIAVNGYALPGDTPFTVSQELAVYSPSYALQMRNGLITLSGNSQTVTGNMGTDGIVMAYEINLAKRDTLDLRLRIPPEWTYNYHFSLLLFGPTGSYHQFEGQGGTHPIEYSDAGENSEQALVHVAQEAGTYLIVLLNEGVPDNIRFQLDVGFNGIPLSDGQLDEDTLTGVNLEDFYSIVAPTSSWSATVVKARGEIDSTYTHSLHWPTADSNTIAKDELTDDSPVGIIAINGRALSFVDTYYIRQRMEKGGSVVPFSIQFAEPTSTLPPTNATTSGSITDADIFRLYEINLQASQTADFRLQVDPDYNYDHDLGMYIFPPGEKYYSISGELPDYANEPIAMSRAGLNTEQNAVFTCAVTGVYAVVVVNFAPRDNIPFTLDVTIQGRTLVDDSPKRGDLNDFNREDLFQFQARPDTWNLVGSRLSSDDGALWHSLHSTALDTNPIRQEAVGWHQAPGAKRGVTANNPVGLLAVDGHELTSTTTYFIRQEVEEGSPHYVVELENTPTALTAPYDNLTFSFRSDEFLHTYTLDLAQRDTIDIRVAPPREWTYPYSLGVYVLPPGELYRNLGTEGDVGAMAVPGESGNPTLMYTATTGGEHLVVVANLGAFGDLDYELTYAVNGFPSSDFNLNEGVLDADNDADAFRFDPTQGTYTMVVVRLPENTPVAPVTATLRWPTVDSVALSTLLLTPEDRVGAFVIDGSSLPSGSQRHFVHLEADVPEGRTLSYQVQIARSGGALPGGTQNLTDRDVGALWSPSIPEASTVDLGLRVPPGYTYSFDLGMYLFAPDATYMSTTDAELGPRSVSRSGPGTEQEIVYTSRATLDYAVVILNHDVLTDLAYNLTATVNGRVLTGPFRTYVDDYNRNEHFRFTAESNTWSVISSAWISGMGEHELKLLTTGLSTNPVAWVAVGPDDNTGVIAINGWELDAPTDTMFVNVSQTEGRHFFVVHADTDPAEFGPIGHVESGQFGANEVVYVFLVDLTVSDHLDIQLAYDQGNWSSDVYLELQVYEPVEAFSTAPVGTIGLKVTEGRTLIDGAGEFVADKTGTYAFVLVNKGPLGPLGFSMGVYTRSVVDQPPMYPAILKATSTTDSITVEWAPNQEANFDRYEVWLSTVSNDKGDKVDVITTQSLAKYTITGLDANHKYYVTIETWNDADLSTASNPYAISTQELGVLSNPLFWMVLITVLVAGLFVVGFYWLIERQKADTAAASERGATAAVTGAPEEAGIEVETIEEETEPRPERPAPGAPSDDAVRFMRQMQGDEEI